MLVAVAGLPREVVDPFTQRLTEEHKNLRVVAAPPLPSARSYSGEYLDELYRRVAKGLRSDSNATCLRRWSLNLVLLFLDNVSDGRTALHERFGMEALLVPLQLAHNPPKQIAPHRREGLVRDLLSGARQQLHAARNILGVVAREITVRDNRTCMLLPRENYGSAFDLISEFVEKAVVRSATAESFEEGLRELDTKLKRDSGGYFKGKRGLVYHAPSKAGPRHGMAPNWDSENHTDRCVIRGHLRFGAAFEPNFHYDCELRRGNTRRFASCHGMKTLKLGRSHVNIAPNDNVR